MRLVQFVAPAGQRRVGRVSDDGQMVEALRGVASVYELAQSAIAGGQRLAELAADTQAERPQELAGLLAEGRLLAPLDHPDPAHCLITGTGLTHIGSAQARDSMHQVQAADEAKLSDSMKMFRLGIEGGKPAAGRIGVAPEWFYKGDGSIVAAPGQPLAMPGFALDGGEEAEIAVLYVIDDAGRPRRVGYALGNEFADHVLERQNYLYLAHSKLRPCAFGPELLLGELPEDVRGTVRVLRGGEPLWQARMALGRGQHEPHAREPGAPPLQIRAVPTAGRRPRALHRRGRAELQRGHPDRARRRVRDLFAHVRRAAAQSARPRGERGVGEGDPALIGLRRKAYNQNL